MSAEMSDLLISRDRLEELHHSLSMGGVPLPSPEVMRQAQAEKRSRHTGVLESWFVRHNAGFISSAVGRFEFSANDIISGEPRPGAAVRFEIKWPGDRRSSVGTAGNVEIEPKV